MSDFHYVRVMGEDGGVDACSGPAIGIELEAILQDGLPPLNIALHLVAGLCEILDITDEDQQVHGDIHLGNTFLDDTGAISLEGFGQRRTPAPEGTPNGPETDLYGLGRVAFEVFAGHPLPELDRRDEDAHDDAVIDAVLSIDFGELREEMIGDVQWFLAKLLSFRPDERPSALETWRTFIAFAGEAEGPDFGSWSLEVLDGGGERRGQSGLPRAKPPERPSQRDLDDVVLSRGPLDKGGLSFSPAAVAGGTAFFNKEDMKAALEAGDRKERKPAVGGGTATNFWSRQELQAMAADESNAPRPRRAEGEGVKRRTMATTPEEMRKAQQREGLVGTGGGRGNRSVVPPVARGPRKPQSPTPAPLEPVAVSPSPFASNLDHAADDHNEDRTVRMSLNAVRTTRTPAPAPQVFRPGAAPAPTPPRPPSARSTLSAPPPPAPPVAPPPSQSRPPRVPSAAPVAAPVAPLPPPAAPSPPVQLAPKQDLATTQHVVAKQLPVQPPVPVYQPEPYEEAPAGGANLFLIVGIVIVIVAAVVACAGLGGISAVVAFMNTGSTTPTEEVAPKPAAEIPVDPSLPTLPNAALPDGGEPEVPATKPDTTPKPTPRPDPRPARPDPAPTRPSPAPTPRPEPVRPSPTQEIASAGSRPPPGPVARPVPGGRPQPTEDAPAPALSAEPATLTLKSSGRGSLSCGGQRKNFDGGTSMNIERYLLRATCVVTMDGKKEAFQVADTGSITCNLADGVVSCNKGLVP